MRSTSTRWGAFFALFLVSCSCDEAAGPADPTEKPPGQNTSALCSRDEALIAEKRACLRDDSCPCGSHCDLGECVADCLADEACGEGMRCDELGRCRDADDSSLATGPGEAEGELQIDPASITLATVDVARPFRLTARTLDVGRIRVAASEGLALRCGDTGTFGAECRVDELPRGSHLDVEVKATTALSSGETRIVRVFTSTQLATVIASADGGSSLGVVPTERPPREGLYTGTARLAEGGIGAEPTAPVPALAANFNFPLSARLFEGGVVALEDTRRILHPEGMWVGSLGEDLSIGLPAYVLPAPAAAAGADTDVIVEATVADVVESGAASRTLAFTLTLRYRGILAGERSPLARFHVTLTRTDDIPDGTTVPAIPAGAIATLPVERALEPTPWEQTVRAYARTAFPDGSMDDTDRMELIASYESRDAWAPACVVDAEKLADVAFELYPQRIYGELGPDANGRAVVTGTGAAILADERPWLQAFGAPFVQWFAGRGATVSGSTLTYRYGASGTHFWNEGSDGWEDFYAGIPCTLEFPESTHPVGVISGDAALCNSVLGGATQIIIPAATLDQCDQLQRIYGCEIVQDPSDDYRDYNAPMFGFLLWDSSLQVGSCSYRVGDYAEASVRRVCRFPSTAPTCAEGLLCQNGDGLGSTSRLTGAPTAISGDLACATGDRTAALPLDSVGPDVSAGEAVELCLQDLERLQQDPAGSTFGQLFTTAGCADAVRELAALGAAGQDAIEIAYGAGGRNVRELPAALAHRLLQRWIQLHGTVASHKVQAERLGEVIRRIDGSPDALPIPDAQEASLLGWNLLLHPRFAAIVDNLPASVLAAPDYRPRIPVTPATIPPHHEQTVGLPVAILEALRAQLELAELRIDRAFYQVDEGAIPAAGEVLRYVAILEPLAAELRLRASSAGGNLSWQVRFDRAAGALDGLVSRVIGKTAALERGDNPLGIEDADLPLYFFGDEVSAGRRFSAISDFLLGTSAASTTNWAPAAVEDAGQALEAARTAWTSFQDRRFQRELTQAELDKRIRDIQFEYGDKVAAFCSAPMTLLTHQILEEWESGHGRPFSADNCYLVSDDAACVVDTDAYAELLRLDDVQYQFCVARELRDRLQQEVGFANPLYRAWMDVEACDDRDAIEFEVACDDGKPYCMRCTDGATTLLIDTRDASEEFMAIDSMRPAPVVLDEARRVCAAEWPSAAEKLPGLDQLDNPAFDEARCYRGGLGEMALTIRAVAKDLEIARSELAEFTESYDIAMRSCLILQVGNDRLEQAQQNHNSTMSDLRAVKLAADVTANAAGGAKDCASNASEGFGVAGGAACAAAAVEAVAQSVSDGMQFAMDEAESKHELLMMQIEQDIAERQCFTDAEMHLVGSRTAALRVQRAAADLQLALYNFREGKIAADTYFADGNHALEVARGRTVVPPSNDFWIDDAVRLFVSRMDFARRVTYLAVRAVEYEYQQSLAARSDVLSAQIPADLEAVLIELWRTSGTRGIHGNRPSELTVVLSLREHLLQLADNSSRPETELPLTEEQRFRLLLQDRRFAVFGEDGAYLGQRIPFSLAPLEAFGLGEAGSVPVYSVGDCAERLWSVNATLHGGEGMYVGTGATARIELQKSNTFFSQWCGDGEEQPFQLASVRPSRNLFRGLTGDDSGLGLERETESFTSARINARFNVSVEELSDDGFSNGETGELAARGLYGEYALFVPAQSVSRAGADGLVLDEVDDVLLRLDYVSVARSR